MGYSEHPGIECDSRQEEAAVGGDSIFQKWCSFVQQGKFCCPIKTIFQPKNRFQIAKSMWSFLGHQNYFTHFFLLYLDCLKIKKFVKSK